MDVAPREGTGRETPCPRGTTLMQLLERGMRLGQRRVTLQRLMMMDAVGLEAGPSAREFCRPARVGLPLREIDRMHEAAQNWATMIGARRW